MKGDRDIVEPGLEPSRNNQRVTAIVAWPCKHKHPGRTLCEQLTGDAGSGESGTFHQRLARGACFDRA